MLQLKEENFRNLIEDLYTIFAPSKLNLVPAIVEQYKVSHLEQRNAIQTVFVIYVNPNSDTFKRLSHILPALPSERNIITLMESYAGGARILSQEEIAQHEQKRTKEHEDQMRSSQEEMLKKVELERKQREEEQKSQSVHQAQKVELELLDSIDIEILSYEEPVFGENGQISYEAADISKIVLPEKKHMMFFSVGERIITKYVDGRLIGLEVFNIINDCSLEKKLKRILNLRKI